MTKQRAEIETNAAKKRGSGSKFVYETLRDEILELTLKPGSSVEESNLAERFGMSRSPIREALVKLAADGLVRTLANRTTIVTPIDLQEFPRFVEALDQVQRTVTRLAARHRTDEDLHAMEQAAALYDTECSAGRPLDLSEANKSFHMAIANAGKNPYFAEFYSKMLDEGRRILHMHYAHRRQSKDPFPLSPQHHEMVEAIRQQDEHRADRLAHDHSRLFHDRLLEFMSVEYIEDFDIETAD